MPISRDELGYILEWKKREPADPKKRKVAQEYARQKLTRDEIHENGFPTLQCPGCGHKSYRIVSDLVSILDRGICCQCHAWEQDRDKKSSRDVDGTPVPIFEYYQSSRSPTLEEAITTQDPRPADYYVLLEEIRRLNAKVHR